MTTLGWIVFIVLILIVILMAQPENGWLSKMYWNGIEKGLRKNKK